MVWIHTPWGQVMLDIDSKLCAESVLCILKNGYWVPKWNIALKNKQKSAEKMSWPKSSWLPFKTSCIISQWPVRVALKFWLFVLIPVQITFWRCDISIWQLWNTAKRSNDMWYISEADVALDKRAEQNRERSCGKGVDRAGWMNGVTYGRTRVFSVLS